VPKKHQRKAQPRDILSLGLLTLRAADMTEAELIAFLQSKFFGPLKRQLKKYKPYLLRAHKLFAQPGRRIPIPGKPLWSEFCRKQLGVHVRTVQRWLAEDTPRLPTKKHQRDKYDSVDIAHLEQVARAAQKLADANPDNPEYEPIRRAIDQKPSGLFVRDGRVEVEHNKYYEGNKVDGKHYHLTPKKMWKEIQRQYPGIVDICPYPRPEGYDALKAQWHKINYANIPFGTTIDKKTGKKTGPTAWAKKGIQEQAKGNSTLYVYPVDYFLYSLIKAGAVITARGPVKWVATEDGSSQPSGRNIVDIFLPGKEMV